MKMSAKKYAYFRDGLLPDYVVRETIDGDVAIAEAWDYKNKKWVPDADAWETIEDGKGNWSLDAEYVEEYIQKMIERFPNLCGFDLKTKPEGSKRKYPWW